MHVWYITRPMFALIGYGWYIIVPLTPFAFDPDLMMEFPGNFFNRALITAKDEQNRNSICLSDAGSGNTTETVRIGSQNPETSSGSATGNGSASSMTPSAVSGQESPKKPSHNGFANPGISAGSATASDNEPVEVTWNTGANEDRDRFGSIANNSFVNPLQGIDEREIIEASEYNQSVV